MKKPGVFVFMLALIWSLTVTFSSVSIRAGTDAVNLSVSADSDSIKEGETLTVKITLDDKIDLSEGVSMIQGELLYDSSVLEFQYVKKSTQLTKAAKHEKEDKVQFHYLSMDRSFTGFEAGILAEITFAAKEEIVEEQRETVLKFTGYLQDAEGNAMGNPVYTDSVSVRILKEEQPHVHSWDEGTVTKEATCKETGIRIFLCSCGETRSETIAKSSHAYSSWKTVSQATVKAAEVQQRSCSVCKKTVSRSYGEALKPVLELPGKLKSFSLKKGSSVKFAVSMAKGDKIASVKSSKTNYLRVSATDKKSGKITLKGMKNGTSSLTITLASGKTRTYKVKVTDGTIKTTGVTVSNVSGSKLTLAQGKTFTLESVRVPFTSTQKVTYQTSNNQIVSVNNSGKLIALKAGKAVITVTSGSKKAQITVTVPGIANVDFTSAVKQNKTLTLKPKVYGLSGKITYTSSDKNVAKVSSKGKITGVAPGKAVITVSCGGQKAKTIVTVPGISNLKSEVTVKKNKTLTLKPELYGISGKVTYQTSNKKIATVTSKGKIKGIKKGTAKITVRAGTFTKTVTVKVK